jgi:hypothetical protein
MSKQEDIQAVRQVLYDKERRKKLKTEIRSIVLLMNFDPGEPIPHDDARVAPGAGPLWFIPATGAVDTAVLEAADRSEKVAEILTKMRHDLGELDIDGTDRGHLQEALDQQAKAWRVRAKVWRDPGSPDDTLWRKIAEHETRSVHELKLVKDYLKGLH